MIRIIDKDNAYFGRVARVNSIESINGTEVYIVAIDNVVTAVKASKVEKVDDV